MEHVCVRAYVPYTDYCGGGKESLWQGENGMFRNCLRRREKEVFKHAFEERFFGEREKYFDVIVFFDYLGCTLTSIFDSKEGEGFFENGALFFWNEEEIWIDDEMFIQCIELAGDIYFENNYSKIEKTIFNQSLQKIKDKRKN